MAAKEAGDATVRILTEALTEEVVSKLTSKTGALAVEEMEAHLTDILAKRPELRCLMLEEWENIYQRSVRWRPAAELLKKTGSPTNLMTLQGNEFWINEEASVLKDPKTFYQEGVHELAADSLGKRGTFMPDRYLELKNGRVISDVRILENAIQEGNVKEAVRVLGGEFAGKVSK